MHMQETNCTLRVIINVAAPFVFNGVTSNTSYEPTFKEYLNDKLQDDLNCTFVTLTTFSQTETFQAVSNGSVDFVLTNSGTHACLTVRASLLPTSKACSRLRSCALSHAP